MTGDSLDPCTGSCKVEDVVAYAHKVGYTTFAPPGYSIGGLASHTGFLAPAPQEEQFRASALHQHAGE